MSVLRLTDAPCVKAPDGSDVRILPALSGGGMAHFSLPSGKVSAAVAHKTVEEIWYILTGHGRMWQKSKDDERQIDLAPGTSLTIVLGTHFQFRNDGNGPLEAVAVTMPPWPGENEAIAVDGPWTASP